MRQAMNTPPVERRKKKRLNSVQVFISTFIVCTVIAVSVLIYSIQNERKNLSDKVNFYGEYYTHKTQLTFANLANSLHVISSDIILQNGNTAHYEKLAGYLMQLVPQTLNINLAKNGIVSHVYPYETNKAALGHDLLHSLSRKNEAELAKRTKKITIAGPFDLVQGGCGLAFRYPIFLKNEQTKEDTFWGFSLITYRFPEILSLINYNELSNTELSWSLWRLSPDTAQKISLLSSTVPPQYETVRFPIQIQNAQWYLEICPQNGWYNKEKIIVQACLYFLIALLLSIVFSSLIVLNHKNKIIKRQNETDFLTNLLNRRSFSERLTATLAEYFKKPKINLAPSLYICIFDLNFFKSINDTYGHSFGDKILIEFARRLSFELQQKEFASRMGGDEFIAVLYCKHELNSCPSRIQKIKEKLEEPYFINDQKYLLSVSIGFIQPQKEMLADKNDYQTDEEFFIELADSMMYENKRNFHQSIISGQEAEPI